MSDSQYRRISAGKREKGVPATNSLEFVSLIEASKISCRAAQRTDFLGFPALIEFNTLIRWRSSLLLLREKTSDSLGLESPCRPFSLSNLNNPNISPT
ncbi:hypothetical protein IEQ34_006658 [Dendrobium chrysotoxum]|uniref:Uncharacterized protein n=1 Tax=Dendrobium chrysotoxum TaxID=161865 RepID=A0AAV7H4M0_DENCH|nr:hypothetical protein IEQ34_006658 [Dendrobium chrysotoxum]